MSKSIIKYSFFGLFFYILIFLGCKKDPTVIGLNVQPTGDRVLNIKEYISTFSAYSLKEDSISSDERTLNLLGSYNDPIFGSTSASFVTQIRLAANNVKFEAIKSIESIKLYLAYSSCYGDLNNSSTPQRIKIYELNSSINKTDDLHSNFPVNKYIDTSKCLANYLYSPDLTILKDSVLTINIDTVLAGKILRAPSEYLENAEYFTQRFKGLYVCADTNTFGKIIMYFNLLSPKTKLSISYNNGSTYDLVINDYCARASIFNHNYPGWLNTILNDTNSVSDKVYIQSMSGPRVKLRTNSFASWKDSGNIIINKAELILKVDPASLGTYAPPATLFLWGSDANEKYTFLPDFVKNQKYFGGNYDEITKSYKFNIQLYIQDLISGTIPNWGLYLIPDQNRVTGNRAVILNDSQIKLNLTYTKL